MSSPSPPQASGSGPMYSEVAKKLLPASPLPAMQGLTEPSSDSTPEAFSGKSSVSQVICQFYLSGSCRYGDACRNIHMGRGDDIASVATHFECGICIGHPNDELWGLLSHCSCVFCLQCIRGWRKDGLSISKRDQVR